MEVVLCILGVVIAFIGGMIINDERLPSLLGFMFVLLASFCVFASVEIAVENSDYTVKALNNTLEYDTVALDKEGKLLEIKIK